jgi:hypothetical protein
VKSSTYTETIEETVVVDTTSATVEVTSTDTTTTEEVVVVSTISDYTLEIEPFLELDCVTVTEADLYLALFN